MDALEVLRPGDSIDEMFESVDLRITLIRVAEFKQRGFPYDELLGSLGHPLLKLTAPLSVVVSREGDHVVAECADFEEFGYGSNSTVAIKDLQATIAELYFTLRDEQDSLGGRLPELWVKIKAKIQER